MPDYVRITIPTANTCLPTTNAVVSGTYQTQFAVIVPPNGPPPPPNPVPLTTTPYKVKVTVGTQTVYTDSLPAASAPTPWSVTFASLTAAADATVEAQLVDTTQTPPEVGEPDTVLHVSVHAFCIPDAVVSPPPPPLPLPPPPAVAAVVGGSPPLAATTDCRWEGRHMTVRCRYAVGAEPDLHRMVAVVMKKELVEQSVGGVRVRVEVSTVWAVVECSMKGGMAAAVIPLPPHPTSTVKYEYYFAHIKATTNALWYNSPATPL